MKGGALSAFLAVGVFFAGALGAAAEPPGVVVSVKPIHALVAAVMAGVGEPHLLVRGTASPHSFALRPSDARALARADAVFWVGPNLETFLESALRTLATDAQITEFGNAPNLHLLAARRGGIWGGAANDDLERRDQDPHIWLDPRNAGLIAGLIAHRLSVLDPENAATYRDNRDSILTRIEILDQDITARLAPVQRAPFMVFHDAYQYFEARYGLNALGAVSAAPSRKPGARRLSDLRQRLIESRAACLFGEPQFKSGIARTLVRGTDASLAVLDPLGADVPPGPEAYFTIMSEMTDTLLACLARSG